MDFDLHVWIVRVDEDKGSPLQNGAKLAETQQVKIERSAEALRVCHTRHSFPPKITLPITSCG